MGDSENSIPAEVIIAARAEGAVTGLESLKAQIIAIQTAGEELSVQDVLRILEETKIAAYTNPRGS